MQLNVLSPTDEKDTRFNCALTITNLFDELDWVIGGYGKPTAQFLYSLNTFVETYVLVDHIFISFRDTLHLNLISPFFRNKRPLLDTIIENNDLNCIVESYEHLKGDKGIVIYTFELEKGKTLETDHSWFAQYSDEITKNDIAKVLPMYEVGKIPDSTPLLILGGSPGSKNNAICIFSRNVQNFLNSVLNLASGSKFHLALPLYAARAQAEFFSTKSASLELYRRLADLYKVKVDDLLLHKGYSELPIPPLTSILLSRCRSRDEIPEQLMKLRLEFTPLREAARKHEEQLEKANNIGEHFDAISEFEQFWETFSKKLSSRSIRIIYRFWDIVKEANPVSWITKSVDKAVEWDQEHFILNRYKGLLDIWNLTRNTEPIQDQLKNVERIFGSPLNSNEWRKYVAFAAEIEKIIFPGGRRNP